MLQEVSLEKAMKKAAAGKAVLILTTMDDGSMMIESLSDILKGARFLVEVPAVINEEFDKEFADAAPPRYQSRRRERSTRGRSERCMLRDGHGPRLQTRWALAS